MKKISAVAVLLFLFVRIASAGGDDSLHAGRTARAGGGMVVSASPEATRAGVAILKAGGNAVDAAVATGFALAVSYPGAGNLGGGGFMVIRMADGRMATLDFRETAPHRSTKNMYLNPDGSVNHEKILVGHLASGVPGSVDGLLTALQVYGTLKRPSVLSPAVHLAADGFVLSDRLAKSFRSSMNIFKRFPSSLKVFTKNGNPYESGDVWKQPDLAETLRRISNQGRNGFYEGKTAALISSEMVRGRGIIDKTDLHSYQARWRPPLTGSYRGYEIVTIGPPSAGGVALLEILNILSRDQFSPQEYQSVRTVHLAAEAMKFAYADRAEYAGDPDFSSVPAQLISQSYADQCREKISLDSALPASKITAGKFQDRERNETTHYSVIDRWGNSVSVTTTLNGWFGSGVVVEGAGFLLNNEMDDFSAKTGVQNQFGLTSNGANSIEPGKRMVSSMTPVIVSKNGKTVLITGSPGGSTIITTVLENIMNTLDFHLPLDSAVVAPRFHDQLTPDVILYERGAFTQAVADSLRKLGHVLKERPAGETQGLVEAIAVDSLTHRFFGVSDLRGDGFAEGFDQ